jgi:hypothetical protein
MLETLLLIIILGVVAYRITRFFVSDSLIGMGDPGGLNEATGEVEPPTSPMAVRLDKFAYNDDTTDRSWIRGKIGDLFSCTFCLGFHVSWIVYALWTWSMPWTVADPQVWILSVFGVAGVQAFIGSRFNA